MEPINKSLIANFSGKETTFFFKISPKVVFCTTVPEYGHNSICQKTDLTTFVSQVFNCILLATVFITEVPILNFAHIFSGVSCRQSFLAVMLAVIMFS